MDRDGPGFLADLAVLWGTLTVCLLAANILVDQFGRPWGLVTAVAVGLGVGFGVLLGYYRFFLDETPLLGTAERSRFVVLTFQVVVIGVLFGALFGPPDPITQLLLFGGIIVAGVVVAYLVVYRRSRSTV
jgi:MFS family permease